MDYEALIIKSRVAATKRDAAKKRYENAQGRFLAEFNPLNEACKAICVKAAEIYNASVSLKICTEEIVTGLNLEDLRLSMRIRLKYPSGDEPDEEFDLEDMERIAKAFRPIVDKKLEEEGLPFKFDSFQVPLNYYSK